MTSSHQLVHDSNIVFLLRPFYTTKGEVGYESFPKESEFPKSKFPSHIFYLDVEVNDQTVAYLW